MAVPYSWFSIFAVAIPGFNLKIAVPSFSEPAEEYQNNEILRIVKCYHFRRDADGIEINQNVCYYSLYIRKQI